MPTTHKKGFTLIELLIVIGILAILAAVTLVALNPAELLRRSRDSRRLQDLDSIRSAITLYLADAATPQLDGASGTVNQFCKVATTTPNLWLSITSSGAAPAGGWVLKGSTAGAVDGTGWIPVNLTGLPGGSSLAKFPLDPNQGSGNSSNSNLYYSYVCQSSPLAFTLYANMESTLYSNGGTQDVESKDGGQISSLYEIGNSVSFGPSATSAGWYSSQ